jgi:hypothetical protein
MSELSAKPVPVLVLSTGRTGTMFLADFLRAKIANAEVYHETPYSRLFAVLTNAHFAGVLGRQTLHTLWRHLKGRELLGCGADYFVDSNNHLYGLAVIAPELYPRLKVIHVVRDPRTYVPSHLNWTRHRAKSFIANYLVPFWQPNPWLVGQMSLLQWLRLSKFESFCWIWSFKNCLVGSLQGSGVPYLRVSFESLFDSDEPGATIDRVLDFIGLPPIGATLQDFQQPVNPARHRSFPTWEKWSPLLCARLQELCGELMAEYGYGLEHEWNERVVDGQASLAGTTRRRLP